MMKPNAKYRELTREETTEVHQHLHSICRHLPTDFEPYGRRILESADCSCGCRWFATLEVMPLDWGVCTNPGSPRGGLLTFEHQGCPAFECDEECPLTAQS